MIPSYTIWAALLCLLFTGGTAFAQEAVLEDKKNALEQTQAALDTALEDKEALAGKMETIHAELQKTKETLITTAQYVRENEAKLQDLDARIARLEDNKITIEQKLKADRASISRLILALNRIRRAPPEAMLARPETPFKTAQSALLMGQLIPSLERHTNALTNNLRTLDSVSKDLKQEQETYLAVSASLKAQHENLSVLLATRESIYRQTNADYQARESAIAEISLKAKTLEDLVADLKTREREERSQRQEKAAAQEAQLSALSARLRQPIVSPAKIGTAQLPVAGTIQVSYGGTDKLGAQSKGLTIAAREGALVVAPLPGVIQFAGTFKKYGKIVIIEHADGFHSLVAGLEKIDTLVGEHVESGEPIGALPYAAPSGAAPTLYYELREHGKPVNPSLKFTHLG